MNAALSPQQAGRCQRGGTVRFHPIHYSGTPTPTCCA